MNEISVFNAIFNKQTIDTIFHYFNRLDEYEKKRRYDDNAKHMVIQALRLFETGQISKDQLKAVIDLIPQTIDVTPPSPINPGMPDLSGIDVDAILKKLMQ
jgi:hypothetical protein